MTDLKTDLAALKIDPEKRQSGGRGLGWIPAAVVVLAVIGAGAWWFTAERPIAVETGAVEARTTGVVPGAVLNASGYVTARRRATVSSKEGVVGQADVDDAQAEVDSLQARIAAARQQEDAAGAAPVRKTPGASEMIVVCSALRPLVISLSLPDRITITRSGAAASRSAAVNPSAMESTATNTTTTPAMPMLGGVLAWIGFDGYQTATMNWQTFSQVAFGFAVTPALLLQGIVYAAVMGLVGGLFPAIRAARLPIVTALREL